MKSRRVAATSAMVAMLVAAGCSQAWADGSSPAPAASQDPSLTAPLSGQWYAYGDGPLAAQTSDAATLATAAAVEQSDGQPLDSTGSPAGTGPGGGGSVGPGCPSSLHYTGGYLPWTCQYGAKDGSGHTVLGRNGHSNPSGWGTLHGVFDHNAELTTQTGVIRDNAEGRLQGNGRYLYGVYWVQDGRIYEHVELSEARNHGWTGQPDTYEVGTVTAYCLNSADNIQGKCPQWVNTSFGG